MPLYICEPCRFSTKIKTHKVRHDKTAKHLRLCKEVKPIISPTMVNEIKEPKEPKKSPPLFNCDFCDSKFVSYANKRRHELHRCKNTNSNENLKIEIHHLKNEKKRLYKQIEKLIEKAGNTTINNTQTNNIKLNSYGQEDLSHITDTFKTELIKIPYGMIPKLIEAVHFNKNKPENKNIALTNKKENKIKIHIGSGKWIYKDKDETINDLVDGKYFLLDMHYSNNPELMTVQQKNKYEKFQTFYDEKDKEIIERLRKECELVLLNNR